METSYQIWVEGVSNSNDSFVLQAPDVEEAVAAVIQILKQLAVKSPEIDSLLCNDEIAMVIDVIDGPEIEDTISHDGLTWVRHPFPESKYKYHLVTTDSGYSVIKRD